MRTYFWITAASLGLLLGCAEDGTKKPTTTLPKDSNTTDTTDNRTTVSKPALGGGQTPATGATGATLDTTDNANSEPVRPDNSAINQRDQDEDTVLPTDQATSEGDRKIMAEIRQRINRNKEISFNGTNVKIPTFDGKVTLRGPVASEAEKKMIEEIAHDVAGKENVTSELEVAPD